MICRSSRTAVEMVPVAEADAIAANAAAKAAKELSEESAGQITDLQMTLTEI